MTDERDDDIDPELLAAAKSFARSLQGRKQSVEAFKYAARCIEAGVEFSMRISKGPKASDVGDVNLHTGPGSSDSRMIS